jgi:hypothetical protein
VVEGSGALGFAGLYRDLGAAVGFTKWATVGFIKRAYITGIFLIGLQIMAS